jgi:hypothetical protein
MIEPAVVNFHSFALTTLQNDKESTTYKAHLPHLQVPICMLDLLA